MSDSRAEFEAWCTEYQSFPIVPDAMFPGHYKDMSQQIAWDGWCAAYQAARKAALEDIQKLTSALEEIAGNDEECRWTADGLSWIAKEALRSLADRSPT